MASSYPGALDSFTNPTSTDAMDASAALYHDVQHANANDAIEAVQAELGTDPAGAHATVKARLEANEFWAPPWAAAWRSARYVFTAGATSANYTNSADYQTYVPWWCPASVTVDRIAVRVATAQTGANARLGIYSVGSDGMPSSLVLNAGEIDCSSTGVKELTVSQALTAGAYWLAILNETASVVYAGSSVATALRQFGVNSTASEPGNTLIGISRTYTDGLESPASSGSSFDYVSGTVPAFWLRRT